MGSNSGSGDQLQASGCAKLLLERFPHIHRVSLQLLEKHETFRDLCEEYAACNEVVERLEHSASDETLRREYSALRLRLESELLRYISEHTDSRSPH